MASRARPTQRRSSLSVHLHWFIRCRWVAGLVIVATALIDRLELQALPGSGAIFWVGIAVLGYNLLLYASLQRVDQQKQRKTPLLLLAWVQLLLDFASLTLLIIWTGGLYSPLARLYVLHMVFASILLPRRLAYAGAAAAIAIQTTGLVLSGQLPADHAAHILGITQGMVLFLLVFLTNRITRDLRRHQRRLERQNRHIRKMSRLARRQQRAMIQHEKMVALGQMAAGVTHEIANPLASMDSLLQLMQRKPERMTPETVLTLREQVGRIHRIIQQMKEFAHPDERQPQTVALNGVIEQSLQMLRFDARMKRVKLNVKLSPDVGLSAVFPQALEQVLVNLMINALDAMADVPEPLLSVRSEFRGGHCLIEVADNGHGIRQEHLRRLFEPFFTTKPLGKGTGLGLSISYSLIRKLGGNITVSSEVGQGTSFTIRLPAPGSIGQLNHHASGNVTGLDHPSETDVEAAHRSSQNWESSPLPVAVSGKDRPTEPTPGG
jgi:signal transduction histidine kinase